jgi:SAM-dependent methyltransferase
MTTLKPSQAKRAAASRPVDAFNEAYYRRFYLDTRTRVRSAAAEELDLGCGLGKWRNLLARHHPGGDYTGVEISEYLCGKYGWARGSAADFRGRGRYDLVLCQSVIQYLGDSEAEAAVENMARLCRGALYLEIITKRDWERNCNRKMTDGKIHLREERWYRNLLAPHFRSAGGGLFLPKDSPAVLYELETC